MKFGLFGGATRRGETGDSTAYKGFIDYVVEADRLGFEGIFLVEHHFSGIGQVSATLNLLSYLAARTERIRLGTAVTVLPWHNPILLAEEAATLDLLSDGRLDLGIGKGYREIEFNGFDIPKEEAQERYDEILEIMLKAWATTERFSWRSKRWSFNDIVVEPEVVQKPHPPLWTGAGTPSSIERVARAGQNILLDQFGTFALTRERVDTFRAACASVGRPYNPMELGLTRAIVLTESADDTARIQAMRANRQNMVDRFGQLPGLPGEPQSYADGSTTPDDSVIIGQPDEVIGRLHDLQEMGVEYVLMLASGGIDALRRFAAEVMPELAETTRVSA